LVLVTAEISTKIWEMAAIKSAASGLVLPRPVTFVTGNAKKLEEVRAILGHSIPFQSLKLDCNTILSPQSFLSNFVYYLSCLSLVHFFFALFEKPAYCRFYVFFFFFFVFL
jgi:hypothetical protein